MPAVTIRDVPEDTLRAIKVRAAQEGKSLQSFLHELIQREATIPTMEEIVAHIRGHAAVDLTEVDTAALADEEHR
ncbi:antitoxin [Streptomyces sp. WMMC500]|uniref:FitA-like ribbon-helix-helix domain-containing protein n=1 Tax=Streptomyces sp. WMMC500 TaxID=3015154 RepID=UPI00248B951F|nr:antitoxin [Streptomyces sp. WMMC500]WBB57768.1 antitoxin [Streptomyces sp. WMMC500]